MSYDIRDIAIGGSRELTQLDYIANNLANISTSGFKSEHLYYAMKGRRAQEGAKAGLGTTSVTIDFSQGTIQRTGNPLDVAIEGNGFFAVQHKDGSTAYTRDGSFVINKNKELVTKNGAKVLGQSGPIIVDGTQKINIGNDGTITVNGNVAGKLKTVTFVNPNLLTRAGEGQFTDNGSAGMKNDSSKLSSGYLEMSNVNAMKEMVEMIGGHRSFEAYEKIIQTMSDLDKISTERIGKLA